MAFETQPRLRGISWAFFFFTDVITAIVFYLCNNAGEFNLSNPTTTVIKYTYANPHLLFRGGKLTLTNEPCKCSRHSRI